jgi:hypothetical protein
MRGKQEDTLRGSLADARDGNQNANSQVFDWTMGNECQDNVER